MLWQVVHTLLVRWTPRPWHGWRALVFRAWGAELGERCHIYAGAKVWAPWDLVCGDGVCIADGAEVYNPSQVALGAWVVVSQGAFLCGATHDYEDPAFPLTGAPIRVGERAWVAARAIILPGVTVGAGCVIGAGSVVTADLPPWTVCAGNPCRVIRERRLRDEGRERAAAVAMGAGVA